MGFRVPRAPALAAAAVAAALAASIAAASCAGKAPPKIGLSFPDLRSARWAEAREEMTATLGKAGFELLAADAGGDAARQGEQIAAMAAQGAKVLIVASDAEGPALAPAVEAVAAKGAKVIAFYGLVPARGLSAYVSFDPVETGRAQARGLLSARSEGGFALIGGAAGDLRSRLQRRGQMDLLGPLAAAGRIRIVADPWLEEGSPEALRSAAEAILAAAGKELDAVLAPDDGTALAAVEALRAAGLAGKVAAAGAGATPEGRAALARGELAATVLEDTGRMVPLACGAAIALARGEAVPGLEPRDLGELSGGAASGEVGCAFPEVFQVTRANLERLLADPGSPPGEARPGEDPPGSGAPARR